MTDKYQCALCGGEFEKVPDWTDEDAEAERKEAFGETFPREVCAVICDDCYQKLPAWMKSVAG